MYVTVDIPDVPYPGGRSTQHSFRKAAENLRLDYPAGGSNVRATIALLLDRVAEAMDLPNWRTNRCLTTI